MNEKKNLPTKRSLFRRMTNLLGPLDQETKDRLHAFIKRPSRWSWHNCHSIIICAEPGSGMGITLWLAWIAVDEHAPLRLCGSGFEHWPSVPDEFTIHKAIAYVFWAIDNGLWQVGLNTAGWLLEKEREMHRRVEA